MNQQQKLQNTITTIMNKAFWDSLKDDLDNQNYQHLVILIKEIKIKLCAFTPNNITLQTEINEALDEEFLNQLFIHKTFEPQHFFNIIQFIINRLKMYCMPIRDKELKDFENKINVELSKPTIVYSVFIPMFFKEIHHHMDTLTQDINNYISCQVSKQD